VRIPALALAAVVLALTGCSHGASLVFRAHGAFRSRAGSATRSEVLRILDSFRAS